MTSAPRFGIFLPNTKPTVPPILFRERVVAEHTKDICSSCILGIAFVATILIATCLYTERTRFSMIQVDGKAYKYDRITGNVWLVVDSRYGPVDGPVNFVDR